MIRIIPLTLAALLWTTYGEEQVSDKLPILSFIASQEDGTALIENGHWIEATEHMGSNGDAPEPPEQPKFMKLREFPGIGPEGVPFSISFATANENELHPVAFNEPPPPTSAILLKVFPFPQLPEQLLSPSIPARSSSGPPVGLSSPQTIQHSFDQKVSSPKPSFHDINNPSFPSP